MLGIIEVRVASGAAALRADKKFEEGQIFGGPDHADAIERRVAHSVH